MDFLLILLWPLGYFARNPALCSLLAGAFTVPVLLPFYRPRSRVALAFCAAAWWLFCRQEALRPEAADVAADLLRYGPVYLAAAIAGAWHVATGHRPEDAPARPRAGLILRRHTRRRT